MKVFYSWQSTRSKTTNMDFIEEVLQIVIERIKADESIQISNPEIDRDVKGMAGSVAIADAILAKISTCDVFVCDVSLVSQIDDNKSTPNPNVMLELGYAIAKLGWDSIVCVANLAFGVLESLPFDIRHHLIVFYNLPEDHTSDERELQKQKLAQDIFKDIKVIVQRTNKSKKSSLDELEHLFSSPFENRIVIRKKLLDMAKEAYNRFTSPEFISQRQAIASSQPQSVEAYVAMWKAMIALYFSVTQETLTGVALLCVEGTVSQKDVLEEIISIWTGYDNNSHEKYNMYRLIPTQLLIYVVGICAVKSKKWEYLHKVMIDTTLTNFYQGNGNEQESAFLITIQLLLKPYISECEKYNANGKGIYMFGDIFREILSPIFDLQRINLESQQKFLDIFEILVGLFYIHYKSKQSWVPPHIGMIQTGSSSYVYSFFNEAGGQKQDWQLLKILGLSTTSFINLLDKYMKIWYKFSPSHIMFELGSHERINYIHAYKTGLET